jgi:hypothetical protein
MESQAEFISLKQVMAICLLITDSVVPEPKGSPVTTSCHQPHPEPIESTPQPVSPRSILILSYHVGPSSPYRQKSVSQSKPSPPQLYYLDHNIHIQYHNMFRL